MPAQLLARAWMLYGCAAVSPVCLSGCGRDSQMDRHIAEIAQVILDAEAGGALRCAPRELAVARGQLRFAELERAQGSSAKAEQHLHRAEQHARAALLLSPAEHCSPRTQGRTDGPISSVCDGSGPACGTR
jgi:hypothetical protein